MNEPQNDTNNTQTEGGCSPATCSAVAWFHADRSGTVVDVDVVEWYGRVDVLEKFKEDWRDLDTRELPKEQWTSFEVEYNTDPNEADYQLRILKQNWKIQDSSLWQTANNL